MSVVQKKGPGLRFILFLAALAVIAAAGWMLWPLPQTQAAWQRVAGIGSAELPGWVRSVEMPSWIRNAELPGWLSRRSEDRPAAQQASQQHARPHHKGAITNEDGAIPVIAVAARAGDIPIDLNALGTVTALATVTVKSQLGGYLTQVAFPEGQMVK